MIQSNRRYFVANLGDVRPFIYGGAVLYRDKYGYHMDYWDEPQPGVTSRERQHSEVYTVYSWDVPDDVFGYHDWADVASIERTHGCHYEAAGRSPDPYERAGALIAIADDYGPDNLDNYPVAMTKTDMLHYRSYLRKADRP